MRQGDHDRECTGRKAIQAPSCQCFLRFNSYVYFNYSFFNDSIVILNCLFQVYNLIGMLKCLTIILTLVFLRLNCYVFLSYSNVSIFNYFCLFIFQFRKEHWPNPSSHGRKTRHNQLKVPNIGVDWFWQRVNASGLAPSLRLGIIPSTLASSQLCQRGGIRRPGAFICMLGR